MEYILGHPKGDNKKRHRTVKHKEDRIIKKPRRPLKEVVTLDVKKNQHQRVLKQTKNIYELFSCQDASQE